MGQDICPSYRGRYGAYAVGLAALLLGCGGNASDRSNGADPSNASDPGVAAAEGTAGIPTEAEQTQEASAQCASSFQACGGLLAGSWTVVDSCQDAELSPRAMQLWGETVLNLDAQACQGAVQRVGSRWSGRVLFQSGVATDERLRSDTIEMKLTPGCLNSTFGLDIHEDKLAPVCESLSNPQRSCSSSAGACQCSASLERSPGMSGTYGVLDTSVVISAGDPQFVDYCVEGDLLHWREQGSPQQLLLRRDAGSPELDPSPR